VLNLWNENMGCLDMIPFNGNNLGTRMGSQDDYSLSESGWRQARDRKFYFVVTAEKDGHRHIA
jgi:hypothetical protein